MGICEKYTVKGMIKAGVRKDQVIKCRKCKGKIRRCVKTMYIVIGLHCQKLIKKQQASLKNIMICQKLTELEI